MSRQQFTPEFKDEAVRHVTEKGHSVQEVAARLRNPATIERCSRTSQLSAANIKRLKMAIFRE
jgi:transposase-like protein